MEIRNDLDKIFHLSRNRTNDSFVAKHSCVTREELHSSMKTLSSYPPKAEPLLPPGNRPTMEINQQLIDSLGGRIKGFSGRQLILNEQPFDTIKSVNNRSSSHLRFTKELSFEHKEGADTQIISPTTKGTIEPGLFIDGNLLLKTGEIKDISAANEKLVGLKISYPHVKTAFITTEIKPDESVRDKIRKVRTMLTRTSNFLNALIPDFEYQIEEAASSERMVMQLAPTSMCPVCSNIDDFNFSDSRYKYMYVVSVTQKFFSVGAEEIRLPESSNSVDEFNNNKSYYVKEVTYGRRLYLKLESQRDLTKIDENFKSAFKLGIISGEFAEKIKDALFSATSRLTIFSTGEDPVRVLGFGKLKKELARFKKTEYPEVESYPISYQLTDESGQVVSLFTRASLNIHKKLKSNKIRIWVKSLSIINRVGKEIENEQIFGSIGLRLITKDGFLFYNGKRNMKVFCLPPGLPVPLSESINYSGKNNLTSKVGRRRIYYGNDHQTRQADTSLTFEDFDTKLAIIPLVHKKNNNSTMEHFRTFRSFNKTIRDILMSDIKEVSFIFRLEDIRMKLIVGVSAPASYTDLDDHNPATKEFAEGDDINTSLNYGLQF